MNLDEIFATGKSFEANRKPRANYAVKITNTKSGTNFYFFGVAAETMAGRSVVPVLVNDRCYFIPEELCDGKIGRHIAKASKNRGHIAIASDMLADITDYIGEYQTLCYDVESGSYYVNRFDKNRFDKKEG